MGSRARGAQWWPAQCACKLVTRIGSRPSIKQRRSSAVEATISPHSSHCCDAIVCLNSVIPWSLFRLCSVRRSDSSFGGCASMNSRKTNRPVRRPSCRIATYPGARDDHVLLAMGSGSTVENTLLASATPVYDSLYKHHDSGAKSRAKFAGKATTTTATGQCFVDPRATSFDTTFSDCSRVEFTH